MPYFDAHCHLKPDQESLRTLLSSMDEQSIEKSFVVGGGLVPRGQLSGSQRESKSEKQAVQCDNEAVFALCKTSPERLYPFFFANPWRDLESYREIGGRFVGLKLAPIIHDFSYEDPEIGALLRIASDHRHLIYSHCLARAGQTVEEFTKLAQAFPNLSFILGHTGVGPMDFAGIDTIQSIPNIYLETSDSFSSTIAYAIKCLPIHRILFGSEFPLQHPRVEITKIQSVVSDQDTLGRILSENARALLAKVAVS